ncbi:MAG TPA: phosphotransferase [Acidimicrobiales bacterium]|nr:phosphotransferase [Acidimicrobiales bacterium]
MALCDVVAAVRAGDHERVTARPLAGGMNHSVFAVTLPDGTPACCKLFRTGDGADKREWTALCLLRDANAGFAPLPLYYEPGAVLMSLVEGDGLGHTKLDAAQVATLADQLDRLYRIPLPTSLPPGNGLAAGVDNVRRRHRDATSDDPALAAAGRWLATTEPDELKQLDTAVFGRGDPNLANCLWNTPALTFIDWEDGGPTNRAFELGDLVEHVQSRATPDATWDTLLTAFDLTRAERRHLALARRLMSISWLLLLQPGQPGFAVNPPETRRGQAERVLALLDGPP